MISHNFSPFQYSKSWHSITEVSRDIICKQKKPATGKFTLTHSIFLVRKWPPVFTFWTLSSSSELTSLNMSCFLIYNIKRSDKYSEVYSNSIGSRRKLKHQRPKKYWSWLRCSWLKTEGNACYWALLFTSRIILSLELWIYVTSLELFPWLDINPYQFI